MRPDGKPWSAAWPATAVLLLAYAGTALASGLDRLAARGTAAVAVPLGPFAAHGPGLRAQAALRAGDYARAELAARKAVAREPLEPTHVGSLAAAWLGQGKVRAADGAFRVAGRMGWREPFTQAYWMQVALATGDWDIAAQRADAILRTEPSQTDNLQVVGPFERDAAGRAALLRRMRESPVWIDSYFAPARESAVETLTARADILVQLGSARPLPCDTAAPFAARLAQAEQVRRAHAVWTKFCRAGSRELLRDPGFQAAETRPAVPFAWQLVPSGSLNLARARDGLEIDNSAAFPRSFARQLLVLPPGRYRLSWREADGARDQARVAATLGCTPDRGDRLEARPTGDGRFAASFSAGSACEGLWLTLRAQPGRTRLAELALEPL